MLKPLLTAGELRVIGSTTFEEFKHIEKDRALARRLQKIAIDEPSHRRDGADPRRPAQPVRRASWRAVHRCRARGRGQARVPAPARLPAAGQRHRSARRSRRRDATAGAREAPKPPKPKPRIRPTARRTGYHSAPSTANDKSGRLRTSEPGSGRPRNHPTRTRLAESWTRRNRTGRGAHGAHSDRQAIASDRDRLRTLEESLRAWCSDRTKRCGWSPRQSSARAPASASPNGPPAASSSPARPASARPSSPSSSRSYSATSSSAST